MVEMEPQYTVLYSNVMRRDVLRRSHIAVHVAISISSTSNGLVLPTTFQICRLQQVIQHK